MLCRVRQLQATWQFQPLPALCPTLRRRGRERGLGWSTHSAAGKLRVQSLSVVFSRSPLSHQFSSSLVDSGHAWWRDEGQRSPSCGDKDSSGHTHHHSWLASRGLAPRHDSTPACPGNPSHRGNISGTFTTISLTDFSGVVVKDLPQSVILSVCKKLNLMTPYLSLANMDLLHYRSDLMTNNTIS
jgi:hypothetical protein